MTKHTPAPWDAILDTSENHGQIRQGKTVIASVDCRYGAIGEPEANARLIAAAPELLEALVEAQQHLEYCGYGDSYERELARESKLEEKINSAIAKAKGES